MSAKTFIACCVAALMIVPAVALAGNGNGTTPPGQTNTTKTTHTTPNGHAYGYYCKGFSKKHVKGTKGTPFSRCVTAANKVAETPSTSPAKACKAFSKKHIKGTKGTPFSRCVSAMAKLKKDLS
jgi:hypothetical protein